MSSKLHRGGGVPTAPLAWQRVSPLDAIPGGGHPPAASHRAEPESQAGSAPTAAGDVAERVRAAEEQGYDQGQAAARQNFLVQLEAMQTTLARTIEEITGLRQRYRREAEQDVVALALAVSRRILHRELTVSPDALIGLVKAALDKIDAREVSRVRVSPKDAAMVGEFFEKMGLPHRIEVSADPGLAAGSVILESNRGDSNCGSLDASVDTQLNEIERGFADLARRAS